MRKRQRRGAMSGVTYGVEMFVVKAKAASRLAERGAEDKRRNRVHPTLHLEFKINNNLPKSGASSISCQFRHAWAHYFIIQGRKDRSQRGWVGVRFQPLIHPSIHPFPFPLSIHFGRPSASVRVRPRPPCARPSSLCLP